MGPVRAALKAAHLRDRVANAHACENAGLVLARDARVVALGAGTTLGELGGHGIAVVEGRCGGDCCREGEKAAQLEMEEGLVQRSSTLGEEKSLSRVVARILAVMMRLL